MKRKLALYLEENLFCETEILQKGFSLFEIQILIKDSICAAGRGLLR